MLLLSAPKTLSRVPAELWHKILHLATKLENYDEFGPTGRDISSLEYGEDITGRTTSTKELKYALGTRRNVILVCCFWYAIAIRFLWSHFILDFEKWSNSSRVMGPEATSEIWSYVKRLDIAPPIEPDIEITNRPRLEDFRQLVFNFIYPNLRILSAPHRLANGNYCCSPRHCVS